MSASDLPPPICLGMMLCDHIWRDGISGRLSLLGMFGGLSTTRFPLVYPEFFVYATVTEGRGTVPVRVCIVDVDESRPALFDGTSELTFRDAREIKELVFQLKQITFREPGHYRVQLHVGGELIIERRLEVRLLVPRAGAD